MDNKYLSIIVPMYNNEKYIERFLDSVRRQTNINFEMVFVDDCSSDDTLKVLKDGLIDAEFRYLIISLESNNGVSNARNVGVSHANGEFITFADVDDTLHPSFVSGRLESMSCDEEVAIHSVNRRYSDGHITQDLFNGFENAAFVHVNSELIIDKILKSEMPSYSVQFTLTRNVTLANKYDVRISYQEDVLYFIRLLSKVQQVIVSDRRDYQYWQNAGSVTHNISMRNVNDLLLIVDQLDLIKLPNSYNAYKQRALGTVLYHTAKLTKDFTAYATHLRQLKVVRKRYTDVRLPVSYILLSTWVVWPLAKLKYVTSKMKKTQ